MTSSDTRQVEGRNGRAGSSNALRSVSRPTPKRQKVDHPEQHTLSRFFSKNGSPRKRASAVPSTPKSVHANLATADAIIIDGEDDTPATNNDPHDPIVVTTSSPDPVDFLNPNASYIFDQNKPSPMNQFSVSLEGQRKSPQDGASTSRLRKTMMKQNSSRRLESASRPDDDGDDVQPGRPRLSGRSPSTAQAKMSPGLGNVKAKVAFFEQDGPRHVDLVALAQSRKNGMKPKRVSPLFSSAAAVTKRAMRSPGETSMHYPFNWWTQTPLDHLTSSPVPSH